jgi:hypothetical protein
MAESPLKTARILWIAAAVTLVAAALSYFDVLGLGEFGQTVALLLLVTAVMDVAMSVVILRRRS